MLMLLPPSESKYQPDRGKPTDLNSLTGSPTLTQARQNVRDALIALSGRADAADILGIGPKLIDEIANNAHIDSLPAREAANIYTGVLYSAAKLGELRGGAKRRATKHVRIMSALYGVVSPNDMVCAYRLSGNVKLPGIGLVNRFWESRLDDVLDPLAQSSVVIDCRSGAYLPFWTPMGNNDWVQVAAAQYKGGILKVVSHWAKHHRGVFTHHLLTRSAPVPTTVEETVEAAQELAYDHPDLQDVTLTPTSKGHKLTFIVNP
ncbi:YaaA family protein [Stomatohabitans albus]|uniref:YaaA family protein n=1 Tax=Stomatohabitans albus TaxID=3110766 RepID=UPI00300D4F29